MMETKGESLISTMMFVKTRFGDEGFERWLDSLSPSSREIYSSSILASVWYPLQEGYIEPNIKLCDVFYSGDIKKGAADCGKYVAEHGLKGIYKAFVRMASPNFLIKRASSVLSTYFRPCVMEVGENRQHYGQMRILEFEEMDKIIEYRIAGWMHRALEICGCSGVTIEISRSLLKGDEATEFIATWE